MVILRYFIRRCVYSELNYLFVFKHFKRGRFISAVIVCKHIENSSEFN